MDKCCYPIEVNGDLSHYMTRGISKGAAIPKILKAMGHTQQRLCRQYEGRVIIYSYIVTFRVWREYVYTEK
jgi:hypothetical protein